MDGVIWFVIPLSMLIGLVVVIIVKQQRTIDRLTDKLMARDYREYASMQAKPQEQEKPKRKPLSWFDQVGEDEVEDLH